MYTNQEYVLDMVSGQKKRKLLFNAANAKLVWQDDHSEIVFDHLFGKLPGKEIETHHPISFSPSQPVGKTKELRLLKIQVGFGCNFKCTFCSQASTRGDQKTKESSYLAASLIEKLKSILRDHSDPGSLRIEFWGGETLIYWPSVNFLASEIRERWPDVHLLLFTNGSLLTSEIIQRLGELKIHVVVSHEGHSQEELRGRQLTEQSRQMIRELHHSLFSKGLFSFNMTLGKSNFRLKKVRAYLAKYFEIPLNQVYLNFDILMIFDEPGRQFHLKTEYEMKKFISDVFFELKALGLEANWIPFLKQNILDLLRYFFEATPSKLFFQKCSMDRPDSLAVDMQGNVLTCQNTTATSGHKIGHLDQFDEIKLSTSTHWTQRSSCQNCPVVALCRGSCMYLEGEFFDLTCDNYFAFYVSLLTYVLYEITGFELERIRGINLRNRNIQSFQVLGTSC